MLLFASRGGARLPLFRLAASVGIGVLASSSFAGADEVVPTAEAVAAAEASVEAVEGEVDVEVEAGAEEAEAGVEADATEADSSDEGEADGVIVASPIKLRQDEEDIADRMAAIEEERSGANGLKLNIPAFSVNFSAAPAGSRVYLAQKGEEDDGYSKTVGSARLEAEEYLEVCTAPCSRQLYPGDYRFALALPDGQPVRSPKVMHVDQSLEVDGQYRSLRPFRIAGWVTAAGSVIGGAAMMFAGVAGCDGTQGSCVAESPLVWAGAAVFLVGVPTGIWLTLSGDRVSFSARPAAPAPAP